MYTIDSSTGEILHNGQRFVPSFPGAPSFVSTPAGLNVLVSNGSGSLPNGVLYASGASSLPANTTYSVTVSADTCDTTVQRTFSVVTPDEVVQQSCTAITGLDVTDQISGLSGSTQSVTLTIQGGDSNSLSTPQFTVPLGWSTPTGIYPTYSSTGPLPAVSGALTFSATNDCSADFSDAVDVTVGVSCVEITGMTVSPTSIDGVAGATATVNISLQGGDASAGSAPSFPTVPTGWSTPTGTYPNYSSTGPLPSSDGTITFGVSNGCTSEILRSIPVTICVPPGVLTWDPENCDECQPYQVSHTAQEILDGMVGNGGNHESVVERINGSTAGRFFGSIVATGSNPSQLPVGYGVTVHNPAWSYISLRPWNVGYEKAGTSGQGNLGLMTGPGEILVYSVSQGRWLLIGTWDHMNGGGFSDRGTNPFNDLTDASQYNATDEIVGNCRVQKWDENSLGNADGGLMAHQWTTDYAFDADDTCGIWVRQKARLACIDPNSPIGDGGYQWGVGADPYTANGYGNNAGGSAPDDLGYPAGVGLSRLIDLTPYWRTANMITVEGAYEIADLIGGDVGGCQTMSQAEFLASLQAQPELLEF